MFCGRSGVQRFLPEYTALKTVLEGGLEARPSNVVVYATSNRRNIVRQRFSERQDDVNERDTLEEKFSLADRFDLRLTFSAPTQEEYFTICRALLDARGAERLGRADAARPRVDGEPQRMLPADCEQFVVISRAKARHERKEKEKPTDRRADGAFGRGLRADPVRRVYGAMVSARGQDGRRAGEAGRTGEDSWGAAKWKAKAASAFKWAES